MKARNIISIIFLVTALLHIVILQTACTNDDNEFSIATSISLSEQKMDIEEGESKTLTATTPGSDAPVLYWMSSNPNIATVDQDGKVTAVAIGTCVIICRVMNSFDVKAECQIKVVTTLHEYVDLGLPSGTLWATCNIGASKPEDYGDYFAWGETEPKSDYQWSTYKYGSGIYSLTKYCTSSSYGIVDYKTELDSEDDAATANWGSQWQMPSTAQFQELLNTNYTTYGWTTINGVRCMYFKSNSNGKSIYLPHAGTMINSKLFRRDGYGNYWSRSLGDTDYFVGNLVSDPDSAKHKISACDRTQGCSVRPVRVKVE